MFSPMLPDNKATLPTCRHMEPNNGTALYVCARVLYQSVTLLFYIYYIDFFFLLIL